MKSGIKITTSFLIVFFLILFTPIKAKALFSSETYIPDSIVALSSGYAIVVDKQAQKIFVFRKNEKIIKVFESPCSTGKKPGAKKEPGDAKTPEGIFFIYKFYNAAELTAIYGSMAFHLDFPNVFDRRSGRNGTNIWIHGTNKSLQPNQSNGCVVLRNQDIANLVPYVFLNKTPVIIEESIRWVPQEKKTPEKEEFARIIETWNHAIDNGDMQTLNTLYKPDSRSKADRYLLLKKANHLRSLVQHMPVFPRDVSILKQDNTAVILFDKITSAKSDMSFQGTYVKLFLEKIGNYWLIVEDVNQPVDQVLTSNRSSGREQQIYIPISTERSLPVNAVQKKSIQPGLPTQKKDFKIETKSVKSPLAMNAPNLNQKPSQSNDNNDVMITKLIHKWASSWQSGDMREYRSCFAPDFRSKGMGLNQYVGYKANLAKKRNSINVNVSNLKISYSGSQYATATFNQKYSASGGIKSSGIKKLELIKLKETWKIHREIMSR